MQFEETTGLSDQEFMTWLYETYAPLLWSAKSKRINISSSIAAA